MVFLPIPVITCQPFTSETFEDNNNINYTKMYNYVKGIDVVQSVSNEAKNDGIHVL